MLLIGETEVGLIVVNPTNTKFLLKISTTGSQLFKKKVPGHSIREDKAVSCGSLI
jgi:hypothetical protein